MNTTTAGYTNSPSITLTDPKGASDSPRSTAGELQSHRRYDLMPEGLKPKDLIGVPWRLAFALQDAGWWLRSEVIWHKPNAHPESVRDRPTKAHETVFLLSKNKALRLLLG